jgi:Microtubule-binding stalk of dynein motor
VHVSISFSLSREDLPIALIPTTVAIRVTCKLRYIACAAGFMARLQSYDKDNIEEEIIEKIRPYLSRKEFEPELVRKASKAAFGLSSWVRAMEGYDR